MLKVIFKNDRLMAGISYLGILCFIPLFCFQKNYFIQAHAKQGTAIFFVEVLAIFVGVLPLIGGFFWLVIMAFSVAVSIQGIIKVWRNKVWIAPIVGKYSKKIEL